MYSPMIVQPPSAVSMRVKSILCRSIASALSLWYFDNRRYRKIGFVPGVGDSGPVCA